MRKSARSSTDKLTDAALFSLSFRKCRTAQCITVIILLRPQLRKQAPLPEAWPELQRFNVKAPLALTEHCRPDA